MTKRYRIEYGRYNMEYHEDPNGPFVGYADHEHALAEKDAEIKALEDNVFYLIPNSDVPITWKEHAEYLQAQLADQARELERLKDKWRKRRQGLIDHYESQYNDLLRVAVEFAQEIRVMVYDEIVALVKNNQEATDLTRRDPRFQKADTFLATRAATALQQAKGVEGLNG